MMITRKVWYRGEAPEVRLGGVYISTGFADWAPRRAVDRLGRDYRRTHGLSRSDDPALRESVEGDARKDD